jgi:hypothetical protein
MKIIKWTTQPDGSLAWIDGDHALAKVYATDGVWHTTVLYADFPSALDACLAAEKYWPYMDRVFLGWLESKNGGYFRKYAIGKAVYVRRATDGWYAVRPDGKVLGRGNNASWFATTEEACAAVEKERYTPVDADPFVNTQDQWRWFKVRNTERATRQEARVVAPLATGSVAIPPNG